jgi:hypothetical protein
MKFLINNIYLLIFLFGFSSCEKVIDIKVRESDTKYVVEGVITNEPGSCFVYLSRTQAFNENNNFEKVSGAIVKIKDNGVETTLAETQPGVYHSTAITGIPGHQYDLSVTINNNVFTATCTMPQPVKLDTLYIAPGPFGQFQFANVAYTDPPGVKNNYRFVQYVNGKQDPEIFWENDEFTDGQQILELLDTGVDKQDDPRNINSGDQVTIEMLGLDEAVYKYWYSLQSGGGDGNGNSAAPANPVTNIKGGSLGYFSAQTIDRRTVIAP